MITVGRLLAISGHPEMANNVIMSIENNHLPLHSHSDLRLGASSFFV